MLGFLILLRLTYILDMSRSRTFKLLKHFKSSKVKHLGRNQMGLFRLTNGFKQNLCAHVLFFFLLLSSETLNSLKLILQVRILDFNVWKFVF